MLSSVAHMTILSEFICVMNVWNLSCQSSVACLSPFLWLLLQVCWQTTECLVFQIVTSTNSFKAVCEQTCDNSPTDPSSSCLKLMIIQARTWNFVYLLHFLVCQFTVSLNAKSSMSFHVVGPCHKLCVRLFPPWQLFSCSSRNVWFKHLCVFLKNNFIRFAFTLSTSQVFVIKKWSWFVKINVFINFFHLGAIFCFFPTIFYVIHVYR